MSEQTGGGLLRAQELHRLLDNLRDYIAMGDATVVPRRGAPDSCGNPIYLDSEKFLNGFIEFLHALQLDDSAKEIASLCLIMEISTYVRYGGTRAMAYRLETGAFNITRDRYDNLAVQLCYELDDGNLSAKPPQSSSSLFTRLQEIDPEDEMRVSSSIAEIDEILLELGRKLEQASFDALGTGEEQNQQAIGHKQSGGSDSNEQNDKITSTQIRQDSSTELKAKMQESSIKQNVDEEKEESDSKSNKEEDKNAS